MNINLDELRIFKDGFRSSAQNIKDYIKMYATIGVPNLEADKYWGRKKNKETNNGNNGNTETESEESKIKKAFRDGYLACAQSAIDHINIVASSPEFEYERYIKSRK